MKMQSAPNIKGADALDTSNSAATGDNKAAKKLADGGGSPSSGTQPIDTAAAESAACPSQYSKR